MKCMKNPPTHNQRLGFAALTVVIIMMVVISIFAISANRSALGELINVAAKYQSQNSFYRSDACAEEALLRLRSDAGYNGGTIVLPEGSCEIAVAPNGAIRTITVNASYRNSYRSTKTEALTGAQSIVLQAWSEVF